MEQEVKEPKKNLDPCHRIAMFSMFSGIGALLSFVTPPTQLILGVTAAMGAYLSKNGKPMRGTAKVGMTLGICSVLCSLIVFCNFIWLMNFLDDPANTELFKEILNYLQYAFGITM